MSSSVACRHRKMLAGLTSRKRRHAGVPDRRAGSVGFASLPRVKVYTNTLASCVEGEQAGWVNDESPAAVGVP